MIINFNTITASSRYHLLTQTVIPRPIAWVLSSNEDQSLNLAPFSFFNVMCSDPALLALSVGKKSSGDSKDTRRNLLSGREFVIHIAGVDQADELNKSSAELEYGDSEVEAGQLPLADFPDCPLPRLAQSRIAYHCKFYDMHELGPNQQAVIYAEILQLYLDDCVVEQKGKRFIIDPEKINPLSRLGASFYGALAKSFSLMRPK